MEIGKLLVRDNLCEMYWLGGKSLREISKISHVPTTTLWQLFCELKLATRTRKKAMKLKWNKRKIAQESEQKLKEKSLKNNEDLLRTDKK